MALHRTVNLTQAPKFLAIEIASVSKRSIKQWGGVAFAHDEAIPGGPMRFVVSIADKTPPKQRGHDFYSGKTARWMPGFGSRGHFQNIEA
jgi:hypothetical protein